MTCDCPTCGQSIRNMDGVRFDYDNCAIIVNGHSARLTPTEANMLKVLWDAHPRTMSHNEILYAAYGRDGGPEAPSFIQVMSKKINDKLGNSGLRVANVPQRGRRLEVSRIGAPA